MSEPTYTAFAGDKRIVTGTLPEMLLRTKKEVDRARGVTILVFDDHTGRQIDFDFRGTPDEVLARAIPETRPGPGRPRLGVVSREVSLLPRHWDWLEQQPQGLSAALRRLVERAIKEEPGKERARLAREAAGKFMWAMAGDQPHFEEASRALYAGDLRLLRELIRGWPVDVRKHVFKLVDAAAALETPGDDLGTQPG